MDNQFHEYIQKIYDVINFDIDCSCEFHGIDVI